MKDVISVIKRELDTIQMATKIFSLLLSSSTGQIPPTFEQTCERASYKIKRTENLINK